MRSKRQIDGGEWVSDLLKNLSLVGLCDWSTVEGGQWSALLSQLPQFADKCD